MTKKIQAIEPSNSTSSERYKELRERFPEHHVLDRAQVAEKIGMLRFSDGGRSWAEVAEVLNENQIIHSQWRRDEPEWTEHQVGGFAHRYEVVDEHIWRSNGPRQVSLDLTHEDVEVSPAELAEMPPRASSIKVTYKDVRFEAEGDDFKIEGELRQPASDVYPTVRFVYEGVADAHFMRFLSERGVLQLPSN
jgi:hypothetical protein